MREILGPARAAFSDGLRIGGRCSSPSERGRGRPSSCEKAGEDLFTDYAQEG